MANINTDVNQAMSSLVGDAALVESTVQVNSYEDTFKMLSEMADSMMKTEELAQKFLKDYENFYLYEVRDTDILKQRIKDKINNAVNSYV